MAYTPTLFQKGIVQRTARTIEEDVYLTFSGWTRLGDAPPIDDDPNYVFSFNGRAGNVELTQEDLDVLELPLIEDASIADLIADGVLTREQVGVIIEDVIEVQTPGTELAYAERLAGVSNTATAAGAAAIISGLTAGPVIGKGRAVDIEFFAPTVYHSVANTNVIFYLEVNGVALNANGNITGVISPKTTSGPSAIIKKRLVLTDGVSYTFKVGMYCGAAGTSQATAAGFAAIQLAVTAR